MNLWQDIISFSTDSDKLQFLSIVATSILSIISVIIALATLIQTKNITREANRANIVLYLHKNIYNRGSSLIIKNFGNSSGKILSITIDPKPKTISSLNKILTDYTNIFLAPNQAISTWCKLDGLETLLFNIYIKYETLGKIYTESYSINFEYKASLISTLTESKTIEGTLKEINKSILEVSDKLN